ncbi:MAG: VWA domain-containing protein [Treponema sp.]|jgi:Ca-activated chloride channel family protein|nr:VWA domain-containing protein [Treponema sp.]
MTGNEAAFGLDRPFILLGLVPLVLFACLRVIRDRRYAPFLTPFAGRYRLSRLLSWVFPGALLFALAGPHWGLQQRIEHHRGLDVILALDVSRSMEVRDLEGAARLERAAAVGLALAEETEFRLGAAVGRGRGILAVPLTEDRAGMASFLESLGDTIYTGRGTNLEALVDAAISAFPDNFPSRRIIVLLSDGESLSGSLARVAKRASDAGIGIAAVGIGTESGGPAPEDGTISRLRRGDLEAAARTSGGIYIDGNDPGAADRLRSYLESLALERESGSRRWESRPRWRLFLVAALIALGLSKLCMRKKRRGPAFPAAALLLIPLALFYQSCGSAAGKLLVVEGNFYQAQGRGDEAILAYLKAMEYPEVLPYAEYGLGAVYAALEELPAALARYDAAAGALEALPAEGHRELAYRISYNRGVALFWEGDFQAAAAAFRRALELDGGRVEAKRNLELSLLSLGQEEKKKALGEGPGEGQEGLDALFRYLDIKEQNQWKSREWQEEAPSPGPDY